VAGAAALVVGSAVVIAFSGRGGHGTPAATGVKTGRGTPGEEAVSRSEFAAGSCVAMAPTAGNRHLTVFLDAGHGGIDPGGVGTTESGTTITEADQTLPVELDAAGLLRAKGFRVVVSRTGDQTVARLTPADVRDGELSVLGAHNDVAARDICANLAGAHLLVGIYFDAGATPQNAGSVTGYDAARPFAASNEHFAHLLDRDVVTAMNAHGWQIPDAGVVADTGLGSVVTGTSGTGLAAQAANYNHLLLLGPAEPGFFTTPSTMPGALIEPLYLTDPFEGSIAASTAGREAMAQGIARAVEQYFPLPVTTPTTTEAGAVATNPS
jgi:N-acetylmuramoyl-L-alanine amidase